MGSDPGRFYDRKAMGEHFAHNPVLAVQRRQLTALADELGPEIRVLDLGCGGGTTSLELFGSDPRFAVVGGDLSPAALATYVERTVHEGVRLDAQLLPFRDAAFDLVVTDDVIEHLVDTDAFARELRRVLRPAGLLLLTTPNLAAWFNRLALLVGMQPAFSEVSFERVFGRPGSDIVGHLRLFTSRSIVGFLDYHGFEVQELSGAGFESLPRRLHPLDRFISRLPSLAGNLVLVGRR